MTKIRSRQLHTASVLAATAAFGVALAAAPANAAAPAWETLSQPVADRVSSVLPLDGQNLFAKTSQGTCDECTPSTKLWQKTGTAWKQLTPPADASVGTLAATAADDLWTIGRKDSATGTFRVNHYDGTKWSGNLSPDTKKIEILDAKALSRTSLWGVGNTRSDTAPAFTPSVTHWNGTTWNTTKFTGIDGSLEAVSAPSENDIWAVGHRSTGTSGVFKALTLHYDGTRWTDVPVPDGVGGNGLLSTVFSNGANDAWAASGSTVIHWDGKAWSRQDLPGTDNWVRSFARYGGQVYAGSTGAQKLVRWTGTAWVAATGPVKGTSVDQMATTADGSLYAVSSEGNSWFGYSYYLSRLAPPTAG